MRFSRYWAEEGEGIARWEDRVNWALKEVLLFDQTGRGYPNRGKVEEEKSRGSSRSLSELEEARLTFLSIPVLYSAITASPGTGSGSVTACGTTNFII